MGGVGGGGFERLMEPEGSFRLKDELQKSRKKKELLLERRSAADHNKQQDACKDWLWVLGGRVCLLP